MALKKIFISLTLLFVYTFSFAHNLVIHDHAEDNDIHAVTEHHHEHHVHDANHQENGEHITHNNHCDEGVLDLLICVINDFGHHHNDCKIAEFDIESKRLSNLNKQNSKKIKLANFNFYLRLAPFVIKDKTQFRDHQLIVYAPPFLSQTSSRGPPIQL